MRGRVGWGDGVGGVGGGGVGWGGGGVEWSLDGYFRKMDLGGDGHGCVDRAVFAGLGKVWVEFSCLAVGGLKDRQICAGDEHFGRLLWHAGAHCRPLYAARLRSTRFCFQVVSVPASSSVTALALARAGSSRESSLKTGSRAENGTCGSPSLQTSASTLSAT